MLTKETTETSFEKINSMQHVLVALQQDCGVGGKISDSRLRLPEISNSDSLP